MTFDLREQEAKAEPIKSRSQGREADQQEPCPKRLTDIVQTMTRLQRSMREQRRVTHTLISFLFYIFSITVSFSPNQGKEGFIYFNL